jgi:hypothetical protein
MSSTELYFDGNWSSMCTYQYCVNCAGNTAQRNDNDCKAENHNLQSLGCMWPTNVLCFVWPAYIFYNVSSRQYLAALFLCYLLCSLIKNVKSRTRMCCSDDQLRGCMEITRREIKHGIEGLLMQKQCHIFPWLIFLEQIIEYYVNLLQKFKFDTQVWIQCVVNHLAC